MIRLGHWVTTLWQFDVILIEGQHIERRDRVRTSYGTCVEENALNLEEKLATRIKL